jgi:hypothetical protein
MKNLFFALAFCAGVATAFAQSNNPYNSRGVDYVKALNILTADYKAGKIKSLDQATLDHYSKTLPGRPQATLALAAKVTDAVKKSNPTQVIDQSALSEKAKDFLKKSLRPKAKIEDLVTQASASTLSASEKEVVLTSMAITYQLKGDKVQSNHSCYIDGEEASCALVGGVIGFSIGSAVCGLPCGIGGALIGALIGSTKD